MTHLLLAATTADGWDAGQLSALGLLLVLGWRLALIALFPYGPHGPCRGSGKHWNGKHFRPCRGCRGTGRKLRLSRRVWNWIASNREHSKSK